MVTGVQTCALPISSVCLKPKFGRLKTKFDDDAEGSAKRTRGCEKLSSAPHSTSSTFVKNEASFFDFQKQDVDN